VSILLLNCKPVIKVTEIPSIRISATDSINLIRTLDSSSIISNFVFTQQKSKGGYFSEAYVQYFKSVDGSWKVDNIWKHYSEKCNYALDFAIMHFPSYKSYLTSKDVVLVYLTIDMRYDYELGEMNVGVYYIHDLKRYYIFKWTKIFR
jgi:hypothetical protein